VAITVSSLSVDRNALDTELHCECLFKSAVEEQWEYEGVRMVHNNWYGTITTGTVPCNILKILIARSDVTFDSRPYGNTAFLLQVTHVMAA